MYQQGVQVFIKIYKSRNISAQLFPIDNLHN